MKYDVILADPPWQFANSRMARRSSTQKYATLTTDELIDLDVESLAAHDCVLLIWAPPALVPDALAVLHAWGFTYKTMLPWFKLTKTSAQDVRDYTREEETNFVPMLEWLPRKLVPAFGLGWWVRGCFEPLIIATKGKPRAIDQWVGIISEAFEHSRKPRSAHIYAQQFGKRRVELFAREEVAGWVCTGLDCDGLDVRDFIDSQRTRTPE